MVIDCCDGRYNITSVENVRGGICTMRLSEDWRQQIMATMKAKLPDELVAKADPVRE